MFRRLALSLVLPALALSGTGGRLSLALALNAQQAGTAAVRARDGGGRASLPPPDNSPSRSLPELEQPAQVAPDQAIFPESEAEKEPELATAGAGDMVTDRADEPAEPDVGRQLPALRAEDVAQAHIRARYQADVDGLGDSRPSYPFWQYVFNIPDGSIVFGSEVDGRLLGTFPTRGDWHGDGVWAEPELSNALAGLRLQSRLDSRRTQVEEALEARLGGEVVHNPTRGRFVAPHAARYGAFLEEWGKIYERFGVPAEIGLAQAMIESGLNGRARSSAQALGFCQWLRRNWDLLDRLDPHVIEVFNQTTQAPYCAAHLTILATMYGSFIPALSEHHAGGVNVGRAVINGERLGGVEIREQYLMGAVFARDLRAISISRYRDLFRTYGPRSFRYAEMVFGNTVNVDHFLSDVPQEQVFAMRVPRTVSLTELTRTTGLSTDEIKRFNPALVRRVPARANVYLPSYIEEFGPDVSFWHRPVDRDFAAALGDFVRLEPGVRRWHEPSFEVTLRTFQRRFEETETEEGTVMATVLRYMISNLRNSQRAAILEEFRTSDRILRLFQQGVDELRTAVSEG